VVPLAWRKGALGDSLGLLGQRVAWPALWPEREESATGRSLISALFMAFGMPFFNERQHANRHTILSGTG